MGDPKKLKKKYSTPKHPWVAEVIATEKELIREYGLRTKKEIWKMTSFLKKYKDQAKKLIADRTPQGEKEKQQMMQKLQELGVIQDGAELDDILSLEIKDIMERRLQSLLFRKGLARTMKQARQFITHRHVMIGSKKITFPSYLVPQQEETQLTFDSNSELNKEDHPERFNPLDLIKEEKIKTAEEISKESEAPAEETKTPTEK